MNHWQCLSCCFICLSVLVAKRVVACSWNYQTILCIPPKTTSSDEQDFSGDPYPGDYSETIENKHQVNIHLPSRNQTRQWTIHHFMHGVFRILMPMYRGCPWLITGGYIISWLVVEPPLWKILVSWDMLGWLFPICGKIKFMFQTTNQYHIHLSSDVLKVQPLCVRFGHGFRISRDRLRLGAQKSG